MSIPRLQKDLAVISKLPDLPNANEGLTAEALKAKFDEAALTIQQWINDVLVPKLTAEEIPFAGNTEILASNIQAAIFEVQGQIRDAVTGTLVNGSVTREKLAQDLLARTFGGVPWVDMNEPTAADGVNADFPVGQIWLRPQIAVHNLASAGWTGNGCSIADGVVTGSKTAATATLRQTISGAGNAGDRVLVLFDIADRGAEVSKITVSINGEAAVDAGQKAYETTLTSGEALEVVFTTTWNSASLADEGWRLVNYTVVNLDKTVRDCGGAREIRDWEAWVDGLRPFTNEVFPAKVYIQTQSGIWWPLLSQAGDGALLLGGGESLQTVGTEGCFLGASMGRPVWQNFTETVSGFGFLRMISGSYTGMNNARSVGLPVAPKLLVVAPSDGPQRVSQSGMVFFDNPETFFNGTTVKRYASSITSTSYSDYTVTLSGSTLTMSGRLLNRGNVVYNWVALY